MDRSKFIANMMGELEKKYQCGFFFTFFFICSVVSRRRADHAHERFPDRPLGMGVGVLRHRRHLHPVERAVVLPGVRLTLRAPQDCRRGASIHRKRHWRIGVAKGTREFDIQIISREINKVFLFFITNVN